MLPVTTADGSSFYVANHPEVNAQLDLLKTTLQQVVEQAKIDESQSVDSLLEEYRKMSFLS